MPKPWEKYQKQGKPWEKYAKSAPAMSDDDIQFLMEQGLTDEQIRAQMDIRRRNPGQGVIPEQGAPGIGPRQPEGQFTPDPSVAAIEEEAEALPRTLGSQLARDVPRTARGMAQGASLGYSDEALAGLRSLAGEEYGEALADERAELEKLGPARLPAEVVGSLPLGFAAGGRAAAARTLGGRVGRGALTGGAFGGTYGFGTGEGGFGNRLGNAAAGGVTGAALGAGIPLGTAAAGKASRFAGDRISLGLDKLFHRMPGGTERNIAARKVAETIMEQFPDMGAEQAVRNAQRVVQRYGPRAALMDAGELTRELAKATVRQGGTPSAQLQKFVTDRQEGALAPSGRIRGGQVERVTGMLDEAAGGTKSGLKAQRSLKAQQRGASKPIYEQTANDPSNVVPLDESTQPVFNDPYISDQIAKVQRSKLHGMKDLSPNSMPVIDATQKRMSDAAAEAYRKGATHEGNLISEKRRALVEAADEAFPDYAKAREVWRDFKGVLDADDLGRKFMRGDVDVLEDAVERMSPAEKGQFRAGVMTELKKIAGKKTMGGDIAHQLLKTDDLRNRVKLAFDTPYAYRKYIKNLIGEKEMFKAFSELTSGSDTAKNIASMMRSSEKAGNLAGDVAGAGLDLATGNKVGLGYRVGRMLRPRGILGPPEPVRREMAGLLAGQDIEPILKAAQAASGGILNRRAIEQALQTSGTQAAPRGILP